MRRPRRIRKEGRLLRVRRWLGPGRSRSRTGRSASSGRSLSSTIPFEPLARALQHRTIERLERLRTTRGSPFGRRALGGRPSAVRPSEERFRVHPPTSRPRDAPRGDRCRGPRSVDFRLRTRTRPRAHSARRVTSGADPRRAVPSGVAARPTASSSSRIDLARPLLGYFDAEPLAGTTSSATRDRAVARSTARRAALPEPAPPTGLPAGVRRRRARDASRRRRRSASRPTRRVSCGSLRARADAAAEHRARRAGASSARRQSRRPAEPEPLRARTSTNASADAACALTASGSRRAARSRALRVAAPLDARLDRQRARPRARASTAVREMNVTP